MPSSRRRRRSAPVSSPRCSSKSKARPARATCRAPATRWSACAARHRRRSTTFRRRGKAVEQLEVLLPICSYCKRIRNDKEEWEPLERYIEQHFERLVTHSICPDCYTKHVQPQLDRRPELPEPRG